MGTDLPVSQALGRQRQHHLIHPGQPPAPLGHDHRLERGGPIPRHLHLDRADLGEDRLLSGAIAGVPRVVPGRVIRLIAHMLGQLRLQHRLQHLLGQVRQQAARAHQAGPIVPGPGQQLISQIASRDLPSQRPPRCRLHHRRQLRTIHRLGHYHSLLDRAPTRHARLVGVSSGGNRSPGSHRTVRDSLPSYGSYRPAGGGDQVPVSEQAWLSPPDGSEPFPCSAFAAGIV